LEIFNSSSLVLPLKILSIGLFFYSFSGFFLQIFQAFRRLKYWFYQNLVSSTLRFSSILFVLLGLGLVGAIVGYILTSVLAFWLALLRIFKIAPKIKGDLRGMQPAILGYGLLSYIAGLLVFLSSYVSNLFLGHFSSPVFVSYFSIALVVGNLATAISKPVGIGLFPVISGLKSEEGIKKLLHRFTKYSIIFSIPSFFGIAYLSRPIINFVYGPDYLPAYSTLILVALGYLVYACSISYVSLAYSQNRPRLVVESYALQAFINIFLCLLLIPKKNAVGAAIAYLIAMLLSRSYILLELRSFSYPYKDFLRAFFYSILMLIPIYFTSLYLHGVVELIATISIAVPFYLSLWYFWGLDEIDKELMKKIVLKIRKIVSP
jgi:O-antigen/teichoic acid export membrane protein